MTTPINDPLGDSGSSGGKIRHTTSQIGASAPGGSGSFSHLEETPVPMVDSPGDSPPPQNTSKIRQLGETKKHEDNWNRSPNQTGTGAMHVRTFHSKLTDDALHYLDQVVNEWLDQHPQYEVKFVTSTIGTLTGKLKEPHLICQIWV